MNLNSNESFLNSSGGLSNSDTEQVPNDSEPEPIQQKPIQPNHIEIVNTNVRKFDSSESIKILRRTSNEVNILENEFSFAEIERRFFTNSRNYEVVTEFCMLKEIIWSLLIKSQRLFELDQDKRLKLSAKVACANVNQDSLLAYLEELLEPIHIFSALKTEQKLISSELNKMPYTISNYSMSLNNFVEKYKSDVLDQEKLIMDFTRSCTLINLKSNLNGSFYLLKSLWHLHQTSFLNANKYPAYIRTSYLLARLFKHIEESKKLRNLAFVIYLRTFKSFLTIIESWLTNGRLLDLKKEFIIDIKGDTNEIYSPVKDYLNSVHVTDDVKSTVAKDEILNILFEFSEKFDRSFKILSSFGRLHELKSELHLANKENSLYDSFYESVTESVKYMNPSDATVAAIEEPQENENPLRNIKYEEDLSLLAFESILRNSSGPKETKNQILELYESLNKSKTILPLEIIIKKNLSNLLENKIYLADKYALKIYKDELKIDHHFNLLRKIYLFESHESIEFFYRNVFQKFAGDGTYPNSYYLTSSINDMMNLTDSCGVLSVDIGSNFGNHLDVYESFNEVVVDYNMGRELRDIITPASLEIYNKVFRFLFKIKWALWTLENFKFPSSCKKNNSPFKKIQLFDIVSRRLCITKHWLIYLIQNIHNFTSMNLVHLSKMFEENLKRAENVDELKKYHEEFVGRIEKFAFQDANSKPIIDILINVLKIVCVIKNQWIDLCIFEDPEKVDHLSDSEVILSLHSDAHNTEASFVKYHTMFVKVLECLSGKDNMKYLTPLVNAINSIPY